MLQLQPVRGTHDLLHEDVLRHRHVIEAFRGLAMRFGFGEIATPIFEFSEVFKRTLGETSDVVTKEMYSFTDRGGDEITLRPEYTAGIARAFISGGLSQHLPLKFFASGPMFRYERPQKGRLRQFHQLDAEILGVAEPLADIEVIALGDQLLRELGIGHLIKLELNSLGDRESRAAYRHALVVYFSGHRHKLSQDSQLRLDRNPLRILDSKDAGDRRIVKGAPEMGDYLNADSSEFFAAVQDGLDQLGIAYEVNTRLVRGLDYYTHTAFEFTTTSLGAQGAVIAGGRYDGLIETMGGPPTPGVGWAAGIERLAMLIAKPPEKQRLIAVIPTDPQAERDALTLTHRLRQSGFTVDLGYRGNVAKRMKRANKLGARAAVILGETERAVGAVTLRDLITGEQESVPLPELNHRLAPHR